MNNTLFAITTGISISVIAGFVFYIFKIRQLYLVQTNFFNYGNLPNKDERILEFKILNRSKFSEEDIIVNLPLELEYDLIGSDYPNVIIKNNQIEISRLTKATEISILILVKGDFNFANILPVISSKTTKGSIIKKLSDVPQNYGNILLIISTVIVIFFVMSSGMDYYFEHKRNEEAKRNEETKRSGEREKEKLLNQFEHLKNLGWDNKDIFEYATSNISKAYSVYELPIVVKDIKRNGKKISVIFLVVNKTIFNFDITISLPKFKGESEFKNINYARGILSAKPHEIVEYQSEFEITKGNPETVSYDVYIKFGKDIFAMKYNLPLAK